MRTVVEQQRTVELGKGVEESKRELEKVLNSFNDSKKQEKLIEDWDAKIASSKDEAYTKPRIYEKFHFVSGSWYDGYTIADAMENQYTWLPIMALPENITKAVLKNLKLNKFNKLLKQLEEEGGLYVAKYNISENDRSVMGGTPLHLMNYKDAERIAKRVTPYRSGARSTIMPSAVYISYLLICMASQYVNKDTVFRYSVLIGNYSKQLLQTGTVDNYKFFGVYDMIGNVAKVTLDKCVCGPHCMSSSDYATAASIAHCMAGIRDNVGPLVGLESL